MQNNNAPRCSICGNVAPGFPATLAGVRVQLRCKKCVQARNPDAYSKGSIWTDSYESTRETIQSE
jgi:hypothetical protein